MFEYLDSFKKGETIPSWLLDADPLTPAPALSFTFGADVHVFKTTAGIWIVADVPAQPGEEQIDIQCRGPVITEDEFAHEFAVRALGPSGTIILPHKFTIWGRGDDRGPHYPQRDPDTPDAQWKTAQPGRGIKTPEKV